MATVSTKGTNPYARCTIECTADIGEGVMIVPSGAICGAAAKALGVTDKSYASGEKVAVMSEVCRVKAGGANAVGAEFESDASGQAVVLASGRPCGLVLEASGASGDFILALVY